MWKEKGEDKPCKKFRENKKNRSLILYNRCELPDIL